MERANRILNHPDFLRLTEEIRVWEKERRFCGHGKGHLLDTARLAWILSEEEGKGLSRELVYAAALLHDIGRGAQYENGTPHEQAGAVLCMPILADCGFTEAEQEQIQYAIASHRDKVAAEKEPLADILYRADKGSRACYFCEVQAECKWSDEKKNLKRTY